MKKFFICLFSIITVILFCSITVYGENIPDIHGQAAVTIDSGTKDIIYAKNIDARLYPASTTKLMTAIILAENSSPEDLFTYSAAAKNQESYSINDNIHEIEIGDKFKAKDAMDAMLLCSANDIAYMIGENSCNGLSNFIEKMNKKALSLGLKNTHFVTPNGLHDPNHYTTAYDLSVIAREAQKYPWIMNTLAKNKSTFITSKGVEITVENKNKLLGVDGCIGGKTGFTTDAGRCLVEYYDINGRNFVGVVLASIKDDKDTMVFDDMKNIINYSLNAKKSTVIASNHPLYNIDARYNSIPRLGPLRDIKIPISLRNDVTLYNNGLSFEKSYTLTNFSVWRLDANSPVGVLTIKEREKSSSYLLYPDISKKDIFNLNKAFYEKIFIAVSTITAIILCTIAAFKLYKFKKLPH